MATVSCGSPITPARTAAAATTLTWQQFFFPGWQAAVDDQPVPVSAVGEQGLLGVAVPAGTHTVRVFFGATGSDTTGALVSLAAGTVVNRIEVDPDTAHWARIALDRMLALPGQAPARD
jgi:hypothetical protein